MMMMRVWMVMMVFFGVALSADEKDHNGDQHQALCKLLKEAVGKWGDGGKHLSETLKKALRRTIFGTENGMDTLESLKGKLPQDYGKVKDLFLPRYYWCGERQKDDESSRVKPPRRSGHSAPHDMLCLCTPGNGGWPVNGSGSGEERLCGKKAKELGVAMDKVGWGLNGEGEEQIQATWKTVVTDCLQGSGKGTKLRDALSTFMTKLGPLAPAIHSYQSLGKGNFSSEYSCSGKGIYGVCVKYYPEEKHALPWWKQLQEALHQEEQKEQKESGEAEKSQQDVQKQRQPQKQDQSQLPEGPRAAALRSAPTANEEAQQKNIENISSSLATLEDTSGTPITPPSSWLLGALFLI